MFIILILFFLLISQPLQAQDILKPVPYNFNKPSEIIVLPKVLNEVSGIALIDDENMACIEDENGKIYIYNLKKREVEISNMFGYKGDYEAIAYDGNEFFIVRSDGVLFEVSNVQSGMEAENFFSVPIPSPDIEALCYNKSDKRLLLISKGFVHNLSKQIIYSINYKSESLEEKPFVEISFRDIQLFIEKNNIILPPVFNNDGELKKEKVTLRASDMAIHPQTGDIYILSASEHLLFVISSKGKLSNIVVLNNAFYPQAEGIAFTSKGDIYISNEGGTGSPTLLFIKKVE